MMAILGLAHVHVGLEPGKQAGEKVLTFFRFVQLCE